VDAEPERERIAALLEDIERSSGKGWLKWNGSRHEKRLAYLKDVLARPEFAGKLFYSQFRDTRDYVDLTIATVANAGEQFLDKESKLAVLVDGLRKGEEKNFSRVLHQHGIHTDKIRGADDQKDPFIRLADALCGLISDSLEGNKAYLPLLEKAKQAEMILEL
jgi:hypothetical protein